MGHQPVLGHANPGCHDAIGTASIIWFICKPVPYALVPYAVSTLANDIVFGYIVFVSDVNER